MHEADDILKLAFATFCVLCSIFYRQLALLFITSDVPCRNLFLCGYLYVRLYDYINVLVKLFT